MTTAVLFTLLIAFMVLGMPIAVALGLSSLLTILFFATGIILIMAPILPIAEPLGIDPVHLSIIIVVDLRDRHRDAAGRLNLFVTSITRMSISKYIRARCRDPLVLLAYLVCVTVYIINQPVAATLMF